MKMSQLYFFLSFMMKIAATRTIIVRAFDEIIDQNQMRWESK
jgi:hypothetical protein